MFVRVVTLNCKAGAEDEVRRVGRDILVPINEKAGCIKVYFLEPSIEDENQSFGVVSIWENRELLMKMKSSKIYQDLVEKLSPFLESVVDNIFISHK